MLTSVLMTLLVVFAAAAGPDIQFSVSGQGINPVEERMEIYGSRGVIDAAARLVRVKWLRDRPQQVSSQDVRMGDCPGLVASFRKLHHLSGIISTFNKPPLDTILITLNVNKSVEIYRSSLKPFGLTADVRSDVGSWYGAVGSRLDLCHAASSANGRI